MAQLHGHRRYPVRVGRRGIGQGAAGANRRLDRKERSVVIVDNNKVQGLTRLVGRPGSDAQRYELDSIEFKDTAVRLDGVFRPRQPDIDPAYIWEAQYYSSDKVYANLLSKIGRFLEHGNPKQDWIAVVIDPNRDNNTRRVRLSFLAG